jgi:hypothetical protein
MEEHKSTFASVDFKNLGMQEILYIFYGNDFKSFYFKSYSLSIFKWNSVNNTKLEFNELE